MDTREAAEIVIAINQHDPRVQSNAIADAIWADALKPFTKELAWAAVLEHYRLADDTAASPAMIRKRASHMAERAAAKQRAIEATQARELIAAQGGDATPIRVQQIQAALKDFGKEPKPRLRLVQNLEETA
ncbi:hypothetical protein Jinkies_49 [Arthrobacter phage Jinkies]|uniref:Uncharacterized protein n=1 Tax=Arthrobacter phage Jinkies TaxID=2743903 RepID=A0A7S6BFQ9_9CAUD|nr:hypothetical protein Jinkies_49 [Arthrobacter phage Jinkies]